MQQFHDHVYFFTLGAKIMALSPTQFLNVTTGDSAQVEETQETLRVNYSFSNGCSASVVNSKNDDSLLSFSQKDAKGVTRIKISPLSEGVWEMREYFRNGRISCVTYMDSDANNKAANSELSTVSLRKFRKDGSIKHEEHRDDKGNELYRIWYRKNGEQKARTDYEGEDYVHVTENERKVKKGDEITTWTYWKDTGKLACVFKERSDGCGRKCVFDKNGKALSSYHTLYGERHGMCRIWKADKHSFLEVQTIYFCGEEVSEKRRTNKGDFVVWEIA